MRFKINQEQTKFMVRKSTYTKKVRHLEVNVIEREMYRFNEIETFCLLKKL